MKMEIKLTCRFLKKEAEHTCGNIQRATGKHGPDPVREDWMKIWRLSN